MIACVVIPSFAATLVRQQHGISNDVPVIVAHYRGKRGQVAAADALALAAGVREGMPLTRARALCPEADIRLMQHSQLRQVTERLCETMGTFSQYLEIAPNSVQTAVVFLDLGRLRPDVGRRLGAELVDAVARFGFVSRVGLASNAFTARAAALTGHEAVHLVLPAEIAPFLARQRVSLLPLKRETVRRLGLFGLHTLGQITTIPRSALVLQFGKEGAQMHRLASGDDRRRIRQWAPRAFVCGVRQFEQPLEDRLIVQSVLDALASEQMDLLSRQQQTCAEIILTIGLEDGVETETIQHPRTPVSSGPELSRMLRRLFDAVRLHAGVSTVSLRLGRLAQQKPQQLPLFEENMLEHSRSLLLKLNERYGETLFYSVTAHQLSSPLQELRFLYEPLEAA